MDWVQAFLTITLGNLIVLVPMLLNSHAGTKYGIPFPVFARAFYGVRGANLAALLRAFIACGWFGIQTWVGGEAHLRDRRQAARRRLEQRRRRSAGSRGRCGCPSRCSGWCRC